MAQLILDLFLSGAFGGGAASAAAPRMREASLEMLGMLDRELAGRQYFAGAEFSAADVMMLFPIRLSAGFKLLEGLPNLQAYVKRIEARPAYQRAMKLAE